MLRPSVVTITSSHDTLGDILSEIESAGSQNVDPEKLGKLHDRLTECLHNAVQAIPAALDSIHDFINESSDDNAFMRQLARQSFKDSKDIIRYHEGVMCRVTLYWIAFAKGLSLLSMAAGDASVNYPDGHSAIKRHSQQLEDQRSNVRRCIGEETCRLVEALVKDHCELELELCGQFVKLGDMHHDGAQVLLSKDSATIFSMLLVPNVLQDVVKGKLHDTHPVTIASSLPRYWGLSLDAPNFACIGRNLSKFDIRVVDTPASQFSIFDSQSDRCFRAGVRVRGFGDFSLGLEMGAQSSEEVAPPQYRFKLILQGA